MEQRDDEHGLVDMFILTNANHANQFQQIFQHIWDGIHNIASSAVGLPALFDWIDNSKRLIGFSIIVIAMRVNIVYNRQMYIWIDIPNLRMNLVSLTLTRWDEFNHCLDRLNGFIDS